VHVAGVVLERPAADTGSAASQQHDHEVDQQRNGNPHHVERNGDDQLPFQAEHDDDGEQQRDQRDRADLRHESRVVPLLGDEAQHDHLALLVSQAQDGIAHRVIEWDEVTEDEGTGIVHIAPAFGGEDFDSIEGGDGEDPTERAKGANRASASNSTSDLATIWPRK